MGVFYKRRRKAITPFLLAFWLFAIFVSAAHACGLDEDVGGAGLIKAVSVSGHDASDDGASPNCDKFCVDDSPLLAKLKAVQDPPAGQALMAPTFGTELIRPAAATVISLSPSSDPPPGIAVNTRFARLAL